ncbi:hypothetical protein [Bosea sp. RAC05]|uniref:hypothetical protein n=1 Tax=Bosea sp. RAC05 TaxID=1842539 RepID=UPI00083CCF70|nr:hypothetical protein [Bosea sp. RAC05]AOG03202.1 hypothetical protein BSY19_4959 [Bosea sp. RAC05]
MRPDFCFDPGRRLLYEHLLRYFTDEATAQPIGQAKCKICGAMVDCVRVDTSKNEGTCLAQHGITSKRSEQLADGARPTHDAPVRPGFNAFNDKYTVMIASAERAFINTNIRPVMPLPDSIVAVRKGEKPIGAIRRDLLEDPPAAPYVAVILEGRNASIPIILVDNDVEVVISGDDTPTKLDRRAFAKALAAGKALGLGHFQLASRMKMTLLNAGPSGTLSANIDGKKRTLTVPEAMEALKSLGLSNLREIFEDVPVSGPIAWAVQTILADEAGIEQTEQ